MGEIFRPRADGIDLFAGLTPKAASDALDGVEPTAERLCHLKARVRAAPEKGGPNNALETLIAKALSVPASSVAVMAGGTARLKTLRARGDPAELARRMSGLA